jgi:DNA (cytosine-5)-methyltransferase 1
VLSAAQRTRTALLALFQSSVFTSHNALMSRSAKPKVIDLFAGIGGFSLGAVRAGFDVVAGFDLDPHAIAGHAKNFPGTRHAQKRIETLSGENIRDLAKLNGHRLDGLIGGPPCQGFSTMGRMRKNDARNKLFFHFFRLVSELNPLFFVAENVPGILDEHYTVLRDEAMDLIRRKYHLLPPFELSAADFGAPTERNRVFFVGCAKDAGISLCEDNFMAARSTGRTDVRTAFSGLPERIDHRWHDERSSWQAIRKPKSDFGMSINRMAEGVGDDSALERFAEEAEVSGFLATRHTPAVVARFSKIEPGKSDAISKFPRLKWNGLCPTLRAGTGKDKGSHQAARPIHPECPRVITTREAARLQSFPDWFLFHPTKWHSFRQIGNSIPPVLAEGVLKHFL